MTILFCSLLLFCLCGFRLLFVKWLKIVNLPLCSFSYNVLIRFISRIFFYTLELLLCILFQDDRLVCVCIVQSCCSEENVSTISSQPASDVESNATNDTDTKQPLPTNGANDEAWTEVNLNDDEDLRNSPTSVQLNGKGTISEHSVGFCSFSTQY